jgi:PIN domain nuclease of toxin-antitoxin system
LRFLIDTHYLLWAAMRSERIESWALRLMRDLKNDVLVSSASVYEIALKVRIGKLPDVEEFERDLIPNIEHLGFALAPLEPAVMLRAARFESDHRDPFDRMLAAQAIHFDLPVLSVDRKLETFGARCLRKS